MQRPHVRAAPQSGVETRNAVPTAPQRAPLDGRPLSVSARWTTPSLPITAHSPGPNTPRVERTATGHPLSSPQDETATPSILRGVKPDTPSAFGCPVVAFRLEHEHLRGHV